MRIKLFKKIYFNVIKIILCLIISVFCCCVIYATGNDNNSNLNDEIAEIASGSEIATNSNINVSYDSSSNDNSKVEINVNNNNINVEVNNSSKQNSGSDYVDNSSSDSESSYNLREIAGYKRDENILKEIENDETAKSMFNDLLHELKPYLTDLIDENVSDTYKFTTNDTIEIVVFHPIKFLGALKDYVFNSLKEIFAIAEENSEIVTE
ncbi:MAG: hypothetical protein J6M39_09345 [Lachnospiraceae bacterium]|nr:hypothetical protein [Lachnospiraceae bacterium]